MKKVLKYALLWIVLAAGMMVLRAELTTDCSCDMAKNHECQP